MRLFNNQAGQSLLEVTITLGICVAVVIALTITTIQGLQSSQFAQNQIQATKYAQDGIERIKQLKNSNIGITVTSASKTYLWNDSSSNNLIWNFTFDSSPLANQFKFPSGCSVGCAPVNITTASDSEQIGVFKRKITLENYPTNHALAGPSESPSKNQLKITSNVTWSDFSGSHESNLVTILSNFSE